MAELFVRNAEGRPVPVSPEDPAPVALVDPPRPLTVKEMLMRGADVAGLLALEGRVFYASDAAQNDRVTGQTSFAATTPTFLLRVPANTVAIPLLVSLGQSGSVAGGDVTVIIESDNVDRYSSSGTSETVYNSRTGPALPTNQCTLYSGATAGSGYGARIMGVTVAADVAPAEGISNELIWSPSGPDVLVGPASFLVYTFAASTGPTWLWSLKWAEFPLDRLG